MRDKKELEKKLRITKIFFSILFAALFLVLSKTKMFPIIGTELNFSVGAMFGPILSSILGTWLGIGTILIADFAGIAIGLYKIDNIVNLLTFVPAMTTSLYFAKSLKGDMKMVFIPLVCMLLFFAHPIGREVWFYSLYWLIPMAAVKFKGKIDRLLKRPIMSIYAQSLGAAFVDHAVGSVVYLWLFNIPTEFWIAAIPMTLIERLIIAGGIDFSYYAVKKGMTSLQDAMMYVAQHIAQAQKQPHAVKVGARHH